MMYKIELVNKATKEVIRTEYQDGWYRDAERRANRMIGEYSHKQQDRLAYNIKNITVEG